MGASPTTPNLSCFPTLTPKESGNIIPILMNRFGHHDAPSIVPSGTMIPNVMRDNVAEQDTTGKIEGSTPQESDSPFYRVRAGTAQRSWVQGA